MNQGQVAQGTWTCMRSNCKNVNQATATSCLNCGDSAPEERRRRRRTLMETLSPGWFCPKCKKKCLKPTCQSCGLVCSESWECSGCREINLLAKKTCSTCGGKLEQFSSLAVGQRTIRSEVSKFPTTVNEENTRRILIVGIVGSGKSSFANSILGQSMFRAAPDFNSVTEKTVCGICNREGIELVVFDTPGFLGDELQETHEEIDNIYKMFQSCFWSTCPGFHAIAIVIGIGRFTREHRQVIENIKRIFGQDCMKFVILVFTKTDTLGNKSLEDLLKTADDKLKGYLMESHNMYIGINNKAEGDASDKQIKEFITKVEEIFARNDHKHYSSDIYEEVYSELKKKAKEKGKSENCIRQASPSNSILDRIRHWWSQLFKHA